MASYELDFVAIGCNRVAGCTDWGNNGLIAYCGGNFVVIYQATQAQILATLPGHTGRVNAVKWLPPVELRMWYFSNLFLTFPAHPQRLVANEVELVSGGSEGQIRVWKQEGKVLPSYYQSFSIVRNGFRVKY